MKLKTTRKQIIEEADWGLYVWKMPGGAYVMDEERNFLNIAARKGDLNKIKILQDAAKYWTGTDEGAPEFWSGHRQIDDEEFERQKQRAEWGLIPDELDAPAFAESIDNYGK